MSVIFFSAGYRYIRIIRYSQIHNIRTFVLIYVWLKKLHKKIDKLFIIVYYLNKPIGKLIKGVLKMRQLHTYETELWKVHFMTFTNYKGVSGCGWVYYDINKDFSLAQIFNRLEENYKEGATLEGLKRVASLFLDDYLEFVSTDTI